MCNFQTCPLAVKLRRMSDDERGDIYHVLHDRQLAQETEKTYHSATRILTMLREYTSPKSLLDVGCGLGIWLKAALDLGITDVLGIEGPWIAGAKLSVSSELIKQADLERPVSLGRRFDVVVCSEVAEHLSSNAADGLIDTLVAHGDYVLFSAAIPLQGGCGHVNEHFLNYWIKNFARHDYAVLDVFRAEIWLDRSIHWWLQQNLVLFVRRRVAESNPALRDELKVKRPVSIVHPATYYARLKVAQEAIKELKDKIDSGK